MAGRPAKTHDNSAVHEYLSSFLTYSEFKDEAPPILASQFDDVLTGVTRLDYGGNTRPLSRKVLFTLLAHLPVITTGNIMEVHGCSEQHARKIAAALRVASQAIRNCISLT